MGGCLPARRGVGDRIGDGAVAAGGIRKIAPAGTISVPDAALDEAGSIFEREMLAHLPSARTSRPSAGCWISPKRGGGQLIGGWIRRDSGRPDALAAAEFAEDRDRRRAECRQIDAGESAVRAGAFDHG